MDSHQLTKCTDPCIERLCSSWKGPFCISMLVVGRVIWIPSHLMKPDWRKLSRTQVTSMSGADTSEPPRFEYRQGNRCVDSQVHPCSSNTSIQISRPTIASPNTPGMGSGSPVANYWPNRTALCGQQLCQNLAVEVHEQTSFWLKTLGYWAPPPIKAESQQPTKPYEAGPSQRAAGSNSRLP